MGIQNEGEHTRAAVGHCNSAHTGKGNKGGNEVIHDKINVQLGQTIVDEEA